ncbi:major facilitator superfamily domain-containing protein 6-like [Myripristis murdjan]|uniref:Major facilitator superfamily domain containing 6-like n=1 Tax=Myripristis murdjan TaxID=586833 RepID=A0A667XCP9_9TELE|nr:major facilitator superfamily domain-containing protein 6-like [Myripristis murdjan]
MTRNKQIDIKGALALAGTFNFLYSCAKACILPFLTLYFRQQGLTPVMTGIVMGTKHLVSLIWSPVASLLSKHYNKRRVVITGSLVCSAAVALLLLLIPSSDVDPQTSYCNMSELSTGLTADVGDDLLVSSAGPTAASNLTRSNVNAAPVSQSNATLPTKTLGDTNETSHPQLAQVKNVSRMVSDSLGKPNTNRSSSSSSLPPPARNKRSRAGSGSVAHHQERKTGMEEEGHFEFLGSLKMMDAQHQLFFLILIIVSIWESLSTPLEWTADDGLYEYLDFVDASDRYGSTGVWGMLGATCGVGGVGLLVSQLSCVIAGQMPRSAVHFYCYAGVTALALPVAVFLPLYLNKKRNRANGLLKAMQLVCGHPRALLCAVTTLLVGIAGSAVDNFLLWQMQDHGSGELHMGLCLALALLSQAAFPLLAGRLSKLFSPDRLLIIGATGFALQCFYYSFLWGPWAVLPAQLLSCFSCGALSWAVKLQCEDVATPGAERGVRRVYQALSVELGAGLGSFAGGFVVQRFGLAWFFRGTAVVLMLWCVCLPLLQWKAPRQRRINYSRLLAADASEASDSDSEQERDWLDKAMEDDKSNNNHGRRINH